MRQNYSGLRLKGEAKTHRGSRIQDNVHGSNLIKCIFLLILTNILSSSLCIYFRTEIGTLVLCAVVLSKRVEKNDFENYVKFS